MSKGTSGDLRMGTTSLTGTENTEAQVASPVGTPPAAASPPPITTQRAYTLRLRGVEGDANWRDDLWATHEAINNGAKAFGDWLLTLRGGLDPAPGKVVSPNG